MDEQERSSSVGGKHGPRVLSVLTCFPFPAVSGTQHRAKGNLGLLKNLGCRHYVMYFDNDEQGPVRQQAIVMDKWCDGQMCGGARREQASFSRWSRALHKLDFLARGALGIPGRHYPFSMRYDAIGAGWRIREEARRVGAEFVILPSIFAHYVDRLGADGIQVIADAYDVLSEITASLLESHRGDRWPKRASLYANFLACRQQERSFLPKCAEIWATSQSEADLLSGIAPGVTVLVVPNSLDERVVQPSGRDPAGEYVGFIGLYSFQPNLEAVLFLAEEVFPAVISRRPAARLRLAGADLPSAARNRLQRLRYVDLLGFVPDSGLFLDECAVIALPLLVRGGVPVKLVESMARGKAVVARPELVAGLPVEDGTDLLVRRDPGEFADAVVDLLSDPSKAQRLGKNARQTFLDLWSARSALERVRQRSVLSWRQ